MGDFSQFHQPTSQYGVPPAGDLTDLSVDQIYSNTCAVKCQQLVLSDFGCNISQEDLLDEATRFGFYDRESGTSIGDVGKLLELHGVGINRYEHANVYNLVNELASGHRVIVAVDSGELWNGGLKEKAEDLFFGNRPDHALIVAGIDTSDVNNVQVIVTDPGTGQVAKSYPLSQFEQAWEDSDCLAISTQEPAPPTAAGMANFDYNSGGMPIGQVAFSAWQDDHLASFKPSDYHSIMPALANFISQNLGGITENVKEYWHQATDSLFGQDSPDHLDNLSSLEDFSSPSLSHSNHSLDLESGWHQETDTAFHGGLGHDLGGSLDGQLSEQMPCGLNDSTPGFNLDVSYQAIELDDGF